MLLLDNGANPDAIDSEGWLVYVAVSLIV